MSNRERTSPKVLFDKVGDWIDIAGDAIFDFLEKYGVFIYLIIAVIAVIGVWAEEGFFAALIAGVAAFFLLGILATVAGIAGAIFLGVKWVIAKLFSNMYVFEVVLTIALLLLFLQSPRANLLGAGLNFPQRVEEVVEELPQTTKYICTASSVLNVRASANSSAKVIGAIRRGDVVEVYEVTNGFARIKYNGQDAYASLKYLQLQ